MTDDNQKPKKRCNKTGEIVRMIEDGYLRGICRSGDVQHYLITEYGKDVPRWKCRRLLIVAKRRIKKRFEKDFESDYQFVREALFRLIMEANAVNDRAEQRRLLKDFTELAGMKEQVIRLGFKSDEASMEAFQQLFQ